MTLICTLLILMNLATLACFLWMIRRNSTQQATHQQDLMAIISGEVYERRPLETTKFLLQSNDVPLPPTNDLVSEWDQYSPEIQEALKREYEEHLQNQRSWTPNPDPRFPEIIPGLDPRTTTSVVGSSNSSTNGDGA